MTELKLSIIIPVYNVEEYIRCCLNSLVNQNFDDEEVEIILLDDGSTDNSLSICKGYAKKYSFIKLYSHTNIGISATRNKGITKAKGDYIYFMDSDDYVAHQSLKKILAFALKNDLDILGFNSIHTYRRNLTKPLNFDDAFAKTKILNGPTYLEKEIFHSGPWWVFIKRKFLVEQVLNFREDLFALEDVVFIAELILTSKRIAFVDKNIYRYTRTKISILNNKEKDHYLKVIYSMDSAIKILNEIIETYHKQHKNKSATYRLKSRQESVLFFLIIRAYKSTMSLNELQHILDEMKAIKVYPMSNFIGIDYNTIKYRILCRIFNTPKLFYLTFKAFRFSRPVFQYLIPNIRAGK
jgi:glycosyltransferase involved in cell wall biosynthesis